MRLPRLESPLWRAYRRLEASYRLAKTYAIRRSIQRQIDAVKARQAKTHHPRPIVGRQTRFARERLAIF